MKLTSSENRDKAKIEDLNWLAGNWIAEDEGTYSQEGWNKSNANSMMGMFQMIKNDSVMFYEIIHIIESQESLLMRLKHFDTELKG